jgi:acyl-CoA hydrolase
MLKNLFGFVLIAAAICACGSTKNLKTTTMTQGIVGNVVEIVGNQMPMKGEEPSKPKGIKAEIVVYEKTNISQTVKDAATGLFASVNANKIASITSDSSGKFSVTLPVGTYSLFVKINDKLFANLFNQYNDIHTVTVDSGKIAETTIRINYKAFY